MNLTLSKIYQSYFELDRFRNLTHLQLEERSENYKGLEIEVCGMVSEVASGYFNYYKRKVRFAKLSVYQYYHYEYPDSPGVFEDSDGIGFLFYVLDVSQTKVFDFVNINHGDLLHVNGTILEVRLEIKDLASKCIIIYIATSKVLQIDKLWINRKYLGLDSLLDRGAIRKQKEVEHTEELAKLEDEEKLQNAVNSMLDVAIPLGIILMIAVLFFLKCR